MKRLVVASLLFAASLFADEGMWMPQQIPSLGPELKKLGLQIDPNQFADLTGFPMGAIVSIPGCTASFVSAEGLIATNHHCITGALQFNSTPERDYLRNGFLARERSQEITATPDARVWVTTNIEDVTNKVLAAFPNGTTDRDRARTIKRRRRELVDACEAQGNVSCQVASFFEGAQYLKITRMEIRDVRLVYAPPYGVGNFGGEVDNWMWPRHTGDFGFYRAYVGRDGKPADFSPENVPFRPKHWLKISTRDLDPNDLILIAGYPGTTHRHELAYEVLSAEEFDLPAAIRYRTMLVEVLRARGKDNRDVELKNASRIRSYDNYLKKYTGTLEAYRRAGISAAKAKEEAGIRAALDPKLAARYDAASAELHKILRDKAKTRERDTLFTWIYSASPMLTQANRLLRLASERAKSDAEREDEYMDRNRRRLEQTVTRARRSIEPGSDRAGLRLMLLEAAKLPNDQRIAVIDKALAATKKTTPEEQVDALLDQIYASTKIGNADAEKEMFGESTQELLARNDSMIAFAASLRPFYEEREAADEAFAGASSRLRPVMLEALRVARGGRLYPDANSTLRVNFGVVEGYSPRNGVIYTAQTDIRGVAEKEKGAEPFNSPKKLLERAAKKEFGTYVDPDLGTLPVAFVSSNVVTNGNSGSASLNAYGELAGLSYDVNWEGVGGDYMVEQEITRTISVDSRYVLWVMDAVDQAHNLMREMGIEPQF
jgi:cell division septum initiation protein DivIVA